MLLGTFFRSFLPATARKGSPPTEEDAVRDATLPPSVHLGGCTLSRCALRRACRSEPCKVATAFLPAQLTHCSFESDARADDRLLRSAGTHLEGDLKLYFPRTGLFQPPSLCAFPVWIKSCGEETESSSSSSCLQLPHAR